MSLLRKYGFRNMPARGELVEPRIDANPFSYFVVLVATGMDDSEGAERPKNLRFFASTENLPYEFRPFA